MTLKTTSQRLITTVALALFVFTLLITGCGSGGIPVGTTNLGPALAVPKKGPAGVLDTNSVGVLTAPLFMPCIPTGWFFSTPNVGIMGTIKNDKATLVQFPSLGIKRVVIGPPQIDVLQRTDYDQLEFEYQDLIATAQASGTQVVLTTIPHFYGTLQGLKNEEIDRLNKIAIASAQKDNTWIFDYASQINRQVQFLSRAYFSDGTGTYIEAQNNGTDTTACDAITADYDALNASPNN